MEPPGFILWNFQETVYRDKQNILSGGKWHAFSVGTFNIWKQKDDMLYFVIFDAGDATGLPKKTDEKDFFLQKQ